MIHASPLITALMMLFTGMIAGCMLGNMKSIILDFIAGLLGLFLVACILIQFKVF